MKARNIQNRSPKSGVSMDGITFTIINYISIWHSMDVCPAVGILLA